MIGSIILVFLSRRVAIMPRDFSQDNECRRLGMMDCRLPMMNGLKTNNN